MLRFLALGLDDPVQTLPFSLLKKDYSHTFTDGIHEPSCTALGPGDWGPNNELCPGHLAFGTGNWISCHKGKECLRPPGPVVFKTSVQAT
jgi:hypothetical protein